MSERPKDLADRFQLVKAALEAEPVAIAILRYPALRYLYANAEMRRLAGRDLSGALHTDAWPVSMVEKLTGILRRVAETGELWIERDSPWDLPRFPGGPLEQIFLTYEVTRMEVGQDVFLLTTVTETTDEVVSRQQRDSAMERMREVLECVSDAVMALDRSWGFTYLNRRAGWLCGREAEDMLGVELSEALPEARGTEFERRCREVLESGEPARFETHAAPFLVGVEVRIYPADDGIVVYAMENAQKLRSAEELAETREREHHFAEQARYSDALNRIGADINRALDFDSIMSRTVSAASDAVDADAAAVMMLDDNGWRVTHTYGALSLSPGDHLTHRRLQHAVAALESRATVLIENARDDERVDPSLAAEHDIGSMCVVPLQRGEEVFGVLLFNRSGEPRPFTAAQADFISKLGYHVSLAVENAWLLEREREIAAYSSALTDIDADFSATLELDALMSMMASKAASQLDADSVLVLLRQGRDWKIGHAHGRIAGAEATDVIPSEALPQAWTSLHHGEVLVIDDAHADPRVDPSFIAEKDIGSMIVVPLQRRNERYGVALISRHGASRPFTKVQADFCSKLGTHASLAIQNTWIYESQRQIADTLQEALLVLPEHVEGITFAHEYRSASEVTRVGGDFFDIFRVDDHTVGVVIGDVSGKGLDAAVLTSLARNTIRAYSAERMAPSSVIERAGDIILANTDRWTFMSAFYAVLDLDAGVITYCNAGHPAPALLSPDGIVRSLAPTAAITGAFEEAIHGQASESFAPGDVLFLYTDGLVEARSKAGLYGQTRLHDTLRECTGLEPEELVHHVLRDVDAYSTHRLGDDLAVLCLRVDREPR